MKIILFFAAAFLFSCNSGAGSEIDHTHNGNPDTSAMSHHAGTEKLYTGVIFTDKYDLSCGMPITAGLTDTAHYKGGIYGFCSPECKEDFKKNSKKLLSPKKSK